jgi:hypothetical protein
MKNPLALACLALLFHSAPLSAANYYVSPSGADTNPGTLAAPWRTIARVNTGPLVAGDTVYFERGGTWRETLSPAANGTAAARLTFDAYGNGAKPVITGSEIITGWSVYGGGTANTYAAPLAIQTQMVTSNSTYIKKGTSKDTLALNQYFWEAGTLYLNIGGSPAGAVIEAGQRNHAIALPTVRRYVTVRNLRLEKTTANNIVINNSSFWRVEGCDLFFGNSTTSMSGAGIHADRAHDSVFTNNHVNYALGDGMMVWRSARVEVSENLIENVLDDGIDSGADGIQFGAKIETPNACDGFKILNNHVSRPGTNVAKGCIIQEMGSNGIISGNICVGGKFGLSSDGSNNIIEYNYVTAFGDNGGLRVAELMEESGSKFRYNIVTNNPTGRGIVIASPGGTFARRNFEIHNNIVYNTFYGIDISVPFSGSVRNNIVWSDVNANPQRRFSMTTVATGDNLVVDNNIWQDKGTDPNVYMMRINGVGYGDLPAWRLATPYDDNSTEANPLWVDPANEDFHLQAGSPAIDAAHDYGVAEDFEGTPVPQGLAPDIGAYERVGLLAYEGFDYAAGAFNGSAGGSGWTGGWSATDGAANSEVASGGLTYTGLPSAGNRLKIWDNGGGFNTATRTLANTFGATPGTYWISFLARKVNNGREAYINFGTLGFRAYQANPWQVKTGSTSYANLTGAASNTLHLFVVRVDAGAPATVRVWVDPVIANGEPAPGTALATVNEPAGFSFNTVAIKHGPHGLESGEWDEIRLGTSFQSVTAP